MRKENKKPLTFDKLLEYHRKLLIPELEEKFVTKKEFSGLKTDVGILKTDVAELKTDMQGLKKEFGEFKKETLTNEDKILKKLDILLTEKKVREYQEEKQKKLWAIIIKALKEHRILSPQELEEIARLEIF